MVQVQTRQGQPVNGVAVEFLLPAVWQRDASLLPARVATQEGIARAVLSVNRVGVVQVTVRVGAVTQDLDIMVMTPLATPCWLMLGEMWQDDGSRAWPTMRRFRVHRVCRWFAQASTTPLSMARAPSTVW